MRWGCSPIAPPFPPPMTYDNSKAKLSLKNVSGPPTWSIFCQVKTQTDRQTTTKRHYDR